MKKQKLDFEEKIEKLEDMLEEKLENMEDKITRKLAKINKRLKKFKPDSVDN